MGAFVALFLYIFMSGLEAQIPTDADTMLGNAYPELAVNISTPSTGSTTFGAAVVASDTELFVGSFNRSKWISPSNVNKSN